MNYMMKSLPLGTTLIKSITVDKSGIICNKLLFEWSRGPRKFLDFMLEKVQYDAFPDISKHSSHLLKSESMTPPVNAEMKV